MNKIKLVVCVTAVITFFSGCGNKGAFPGYEKSPSGLYSKFFVSNETGRKPKNGEFASILIKYYNGKDSLLFNSTDVKESDHGYLTQGFFGSGFKGSLEEALMTMSEGDSASFKISADSIYLKTFHAKELPKYIEKGSMLTFYIKMGKIKTQQELLNEMNAKETAERETYLKQNNIAVEPTETGLYIIETSAGKGDLIRTGQTASVKYAGKFLNGKVFDASDLHGGKPYDVTIGSTQVIPGWIEALQKMKKGEKATLIIPSSLAYGAQGGGPIQPYTTLVFEIEVVDVK